MKTHTLLVLAAGFSLTSSLARADIPTPRPPVPPVKARPQPMRVEPKEPPKVVAKLLMKALALPGGPPVSMDYLAVEPGAGRIWVPAGNTGRVDVVDGKTGKVVEIAGWKTVKRGERTMGPSSATVGDGVVYVGSRADSTICAIDVKTLKRGACVTLPSSPDGVSYVATTREVWVTTPQDLTLTILDASNPAAPSLKGKIQLAGEPEGYAVDAERGLFYTNLEDKDRTLVLDVHTRKVVSTWEPHCGEAGPRGVAIDTARQLAFVACTDHVVTLSTDKADPGAPRGQLPTGPGVDNIDYLPSHKLLYVASGKTATLTVAEVSDSGALSRHAVADTASGARTVVVDASGGAWLPDPAGGRLLWVTSDK